MRLLRVDRTVIERYNLAPAASGVLVLATGETGQGIGLQEGDVIALINGTRVESEAMVRAVLTRPGRYRFSVIRGRERVILVHSV